MNKDLIRHYRRTKKTRQKIKELNKMRLSVHISLQHIYAQIFNADGSRVLASASTLDKELKEQATSPNIAVATLVGELIAKRATAAGIREVSFDRSGRKYHGRVKALAEAARNNGLEF